MQNRVQSRPAGASPSSSSGGDGSGSSFCLGDIMELDAGSGGDHKAPGSPRSKHSATEQRRRCKINERFQILRELVPQSDQKRDRATFLSEVIEYVKFLQEKVQKHEACAGGNWTQENTKLVPWSSNRVPVDLMPGAAPTATKFSAGNFLDNSIPTMLDPTMPEMLGNAKTVVESDKLNAEIIESQYHSQWQQLPCPADCLVDSEMSNEKEEMAIDEGTITVSSVYSQKPASPCMSIWAEEQFPIIYPVQRKTCQPQTKSRKVLGGPKAVRNLRKRLKRQSSRSPFAWMVLISTCFYG